MKRGIFMSLNKNSRSSYHGPRGRRDKDHTPKRLNFDYDKPKRKPIKGGWIPFAAAGAVVVLLGISAAVLHSRSVSEPEGAAKATASQASETTPVLLTVNGISLEGLSKDEAVSRISKSLSWKMTAAYEDDSKELPNILTDAIRDWLTSKEEETVSGDLTLSAAELPTDALKIPFPRNWKNWQKNGMFLQRSVPWTTMTTRRDSLCSGKAAPAHVLTGISWPMIF